MERKRGSAFITSRKGFCYLTIKIGRENFDLKRIRNYTIDPEDKRYFRRAYPDIVFDWKKIERQLVEKRNQSRRYRSRRRTRKSERFSQTREPFYAVYEPSTRTVYASDGASPLALLDAIMRLDCSPFPAAPQEPHKAPNPKLELVKKGRE